MPAGGQTTKQRARRSGSVKQGRATKGRVGSVRIKRGPRKGQVVKAYIYANGSWAEIKGNGRTGAVQKAGTGKTRIKPRYSKAALAARAQRKKMGLTFGKSHKANVRRNKVLKKFAPRAAIPHTLKRAPSRHRGGSTMTGSGGGWSASPFTKRKSTRKSTRKRSGRRKKR